MVLYRGHRPAAVCRRALECCVTGWVMRRLALLVAAGFGLAPLLALEPMRREERRGWTIEHGLPSNHVLSLWRSGRGPLWVGTDAGLARFNGVTFRVVSQAAITALAEAPDGVLWAGTRDSGVFLVRDTGTIREPGLGALNDVEVTAMAVTEDGALWMGTSAGLARWSGGGLTVYRVKDGVPAKRVLWLTAVSRETVVAGGSTGGAVEFGPRGRIQPDRRTAPPRSVQFLDQEGNTWLGGLHGLERHRRDGFETLGRAEGLLTDDVRVLAPARDGGVWMGTAEGLIHSRRGPAQGLPDAPVSAVLELPDGTLYAGTHSQGLWKRRGGGWERVPTQGGGLDFVLCLRRGSDSSIWVGTAGGVIRLRDGRMEKFGKTEGLPSNGVHDLLEAPGGTFIAATDAGLGFWDGSGWTTESRAGRRSIYAVQPDGDGGYWLGAKDGIHRWREGVLTPVTVRETVCGGRALSLIERRGQLWWLTDRGVCTGVSGGTEIAARLAAPAGGFRQEIGWQPAAWLDQEQRLWFATSSGVLRFSELPRLEPPQVVIEEVRAGGAPLALGAAATIPAGQESFEIEYAALALGHSDEVTYRYRLAGFESSWIEAQSRRSVAYSHTPRSQYRFEVSARLGNSEWGPVTRFDVRLLPRFYQTFWFRVLLAAVLAGALYGFHRWRLSILNRQWALVTDERVRIARELHDTLAQGIGSISAQLEAAHLLWQQQPDRSRNHLDHAREAARTYLDNVRAFVRNLRTNVPLEIELETGLLALGGEVGNGLVQVQISGRPRALKLPQRECLYGVAREALHNAVRHADPEHVELLLTYERGGVRLKVRDDGNGFQPAGAGAAEGHFGLAGMRERAEQAGGRLKVRSELGRGCEIELEVPYG